MPTLNNLPNNSAKPLIRILSHKNSHPLQGCESNEFPLTSFHIHINHDLIPDPTRKSFLTITRPYITCSFSFNDHSLHTLFNNKINKNSSSETIEIVFKTLSGDEYKDVLVYTLKNEVFLKANEEADNLGFSFYVKAFFYECRVKHTIIDINGKTQGSIDGSFKSHN